MVRFDSFSLPETVLRAITEMGFEEASPIQEAAIPVVMTGRDIIGQAQTGTGKTAAFGIPIVMASLEGRPALVLVPTRELAQQVCAEIERIGVHAGVRPIALYGGASFGEQARAIQRGECDVIVATPGRLRDHFERGTLEPSAAKLVVLDEADEMLKMGFIDEVEAILDQIGTDRQTLLFSATMPEQIVRLAKKYMVEPERIVAERPNDSVANANTEQFAVNVEHREKADALVRFVAVERPTGVLVFRHTRESVDELVRELRAKGLQADALHGGMSQDGREQVLERLRNGHGRVVVATNVAARGLDVDCISLVFNYDAPREAESYVHRIGRTGRAGREGKSFLFVTPADRGRVRNIERALGHRITWREVPTDRQVHEAVRAHAVGELTTRAAETHPDALALVDECIAKGVEPRALAAGLLAALAKHEPLAAPPLEARREKRIAVQPKAGGAMVALAIDVGRDDNVRPGDIVGAFANEGGLTGSMIGRIDILPRMSVVEVPADIVNDLVRTMHGATIRGRNVTMRVAERWQFRAMAR